MFHWNSGSEDPDTAGAAATGGGAALLARVEASETVFQTSRIQLPHSELALARGAGAAVFGAVATELAHLLSRSTVSALGAEGAAGKLGVLLLAGAEA